MPKKRNLLKQLFDRPNNDKLNKYESEQNSAENEALLLNYYASLAVYHPDIILLFSPEGKLLSQNKSSINKLLGHAPHNKLVLKELVTEETYSCLSKGFSNALKGKSEKQEVKINDKNRKVLHLNVIFIPIKKPDGLVAGVYLIVSDNTQHMEMLHSLELKEKHLAHAQEIANIGSWEYLIAEDNLICSNNFLAIFGLKKSAFVSMDRPFEQVHPDDLEQTAQLVEQAIKNGTSYTNEFRIFHGQTKELRYLKVRADAIWENNKPYKLVGVIYDITYRKQLEIKLIEKNATYKHLFNNLDAGFWMRDSLNGEVIFVSEGFENILETPLSTFQQDADFWKNMIPPEHRDELFAKYKLLAKGEKIEHHYQIISGDGTTKWLYEQTIPWVNEQGKVQNIFGFVTDISSQMEMQQKLQYIATFDSLTGLPNQESLYQEIDQLCNDTNIKNFALLHLDLDQFNRINHSLGYEIGDQALKKVAQQILSILPKNSFLARFGSNEFAIIIQDYAHKQDVFNFSESIIKQMETAINVNEYQLYITTSIGISFYPENGEDQLSILENAYSALYHAKQLGKNNYQIYAYTKDISSYKKYLLEGDLRKAIDKEEFVLYYQPQVDPRHGVIRGAEALIRWHHEEWGIIPPNEFIPLAESNHLIHDIGDWVIKNVCAQLREWKDHGYPLYPISVNISPLRFLKEGLIETVKEQLEKYEIPAHYLHLELTESSLLRNEKHIVTTLVNLRKLGVKIAIDDFGTGYSSLTYLHHFQADILKIDQSFITNLQREDNPDLAIVSAILHLAKGLNMTVIAEGVEEYEQYEILNQKECDLIQGYLYSEPVPVETFAKMMKTGYLKPKKQKSPQKLENERRAYYRFAPHDYIPAKMTINEVNKRRVELGSAEILLENISLNGIKIISNLRLPVNSALKVKFAFTLMDTFFQLNGNFVWQHEEKPELFSYGVTLTMKEAEKDRLAKVINKMTVLQNLKQIIPDTSFINENPYSYFQKNE